MNVFFLRGLRIASAKRSRWIAKVALATATTALCVGTPGAAEAQASMPTPANVHSRSATDGQLPYREVIAYKDDRRVVRVFLTFDCPISFLYDSVLWKWSRDLPRNWKVEFTPVFTKEPWSFAALKAFTAVKLADPNKLEVFMNRAFAAIQQEKRNPMEEQTWRDIVQSSGVNMLRFMQAWKSLASAEGVVDKTVERVTHYGVSVTPTVVIDGRYVITPENTNGNGELFMQLLNGMISKAEGYA